MITKVPLEDGVFYSVEDGYAFLLKSMEPGLLEKGSEYTLSTMLRMWDLTRDGEQVGFFFSSAFRVESKGGYLVTFMETKREKATTSKLIIRHEKLMVYDLPGCGAMALSTKVSPEVLSVLMEQ
jgi:hypothetical protein